MKPSGSGHSRIIANNPRGARESRSELGAPVRYAVFSIASRLRFRPASSNPPPIVTADRKREREKRAANPHVDLSCSLRTSTTEFALIYGRLQIKREIESFFPSRARFHLRIRRRE